ncbi:MAG: Rpn family recombination-promoting nuclease/putative transposase [Muribaculaceae bacterium]|nr:Rpn family recombination-promoting nuclease/putative transposase [Muribaculaceae bacterium]
MNTKNSTYINPLTDFGFKYIFGREGDKEFVISFLNALGIGGDRPIVSVEFIDKENKGESKDDRALIYDLHCKLKDDTKIIVEMQNRYQTHFDDRAIFYLAADLHNQGEKGMGWDYRLTPVYGVFLMNFEWKDVEEQHLREDVCLYNMQAQRIFSDKMRMTFLKIPMMDKNADDCDTTLEKWLYLLKYMDKMEAIPNTFMKEPVFRRLEEKAKYAALNEKEKKAYRESLKIYRDNYAIAETERKEGREEGRKEGREDAFRQVIKNMLGMGMDLEAVAKATGLSIQELENLN